METHFASPERTPQPILAEVALAVKSDPVLGSLLESVGGMLAVLDENRQILTVNVELLERLGLSDRGDCLGLRPGEEMPAGCGTGRWCRSCGAAIAIVTAQANDESVDRECALETEGAAGPSELFLRVRCTPIVREGRKLLVLFLQDITREQRLTMLERVFFHDVNGLVTGIMGYTELLQRRCDETNRPLVDALQRVSARMANEVTLQGQLMRGEAVPATGQFARVRARRILQELRDQFQQSPLKEGRQVTYQGRSQSSVLVTDASLVVRILRNMVTNALEASQPGEEIRVSFEEGADQAVFTVWNARAIPSEVALRVFQRNFSTKGGLGRGLGTWSMKFFGEQILRGEVGFSSSPEEGTAFVLRLPMQSGRRSEI